MFIGVICGVFLWKMITNSFIFLLFMQAAAFTPVNKVYEETAVFLLFSAIGGSLQNETVFRVIENVIWNKGEEQYTKFYLQCVHYY